MFKKKLLIIFFIFFSNYCYALSNQEVRQAIQDWINSQEYPQEMDELTIMIDTVTTSRGILYTYQLNLHQDDLIDFRPVFNSIKSTALEALCNNTAMIWYKNNEVEMTYEYLDKDENLITLFKIHSSSC